MLTEPGRLRGRLYRRIGHFNNGSSPNNLPINHLEQKEAVMAVGWSRDGSVQEQIDAKVESEVPLAKSRLPHGESLTHCEECEVAIPEARRKAMP